MDKFENLLNNLNSEQKEAVYSSDRQLLLLAGAGTGKTQTMIAKILYTTNVLKVSPTSVLALTFTNAAGKEMESRYSVYAENPNNCPYFGTFHSFCYNILISDQAICKYLGYNCPPRIISEIEEKTYQTKAEVLTSVKLPKRAYSISYEPKNSEKFEFEVFHKTMNKLLVQDGKITFDRLCYRVSKLFIDKHPLIIKYFQKYTHIYVDEFQDTDPIQWMFVQSFLDRSSIVLCGDIRQALYSFRGADSSIIKSLSKSSNWHVIKLQTNYRSSDAICNYANDWVKKYNDDVPDIRLQSTFQGECVQQLKTYEFLDTLHTSLHTHSGTTAILCRTNAEVSRICDILIGEHISYSVKESRKIRGLFVAAIDSKFKQEYLISRLPEIEKASLLRRMYLHPTYSPLHYLESRLPEVVEEIEKIQDSENFGDIRLLYELGEIALEDLSNSVFTHDSNLYVGTIHSVKGLEFDTVFVYGVNSKSFKIESSEDMMNLYYVACTRAKSHLYIISE